MTIRNSKSEIRNVFVVTGDPGGARVLIPGILALKRRHTGWKVEILAGPNSRDLWRAAGFRPKPWPARRTRDWCRSLLLNLNPDLLVTGTSFENPVESWFRLAARERGVASFSALDHWCNYRHRYELGGKLALPDRIGVMDALAREKMVRAGIPSRRLVVVGHPVLEPFMGKANQKTRSGRRILFLSEPISWNGALNPGVVRYPKHNEMTMLRSLLRVFEACPELRRFSLHVRPHPLEPPTRLMKVLRDYAPTSLKVSTDRSRSLEKDLGDARVVLGITSIALLQARLAKCPVLSLQPDHARGWIPDDIMCFLPRVRSSRSFISAVSKFIRTRRATGRWFQAGIRPRLPSDSSGRLAHAMEELIHG